MKLSVIIAISSIIAFTGAQDLAGGGAGNPITFKCEGKAYITQVLGRVSENFDRLQFRCSDGKLSDRYGTSNGGADFEMPIIHTGIRAITAVADKYVKAIQYGPFKVAGRVDSGNTKNFASQNCPFNTVTLRAGWIVDAIGFSGDCHVTGNVPANPTEFQIKDAMQGKRRGFMRSMYCKPKAFITQIFGRAADVVDAIGVKCSDGETFKVVGGAGGKDFQIPESQQGYTELFVKTGERVDAIGVQPSALFGGGGGSQYKFSFNNGQKNCVIGGIIMYVGNTVNGIQAVFKCEDPTTAVAPAPAPAAPMAPAPAPPAQAQARTQQQPQTVRAAPPPTVRQAPMQLAQNIAQAHAAAFAQTRR